MIKLVINLLFLLVFQACQVSENVSSANQIGSVALPNSSFSVELPQDGWKKLGQNVTISLIHPQTILVSGTPYINVEIDTASQEKVWRRFYYQSGSGSTTINFTRTVMSYDEDTDGVKISSSINLNGGTIGYTDTNELLTNISTELSIPNSFIRFDGVAPTLTDKPSLIPVVGPVSGSYSTNQSLNYSVRFSEPVYAKGNVSFNIALNGIPSSVSYESGSGSTLLKFSRKILVTDYDDDGFSTATMLNIISGSANDITDEAGNSLLPIFPTTSSNAVLVNVTGPTILSITPPTATTYVAGQNLDFYVNMSQNVNVTGSPGLSVSLTTGNVLARYVSGSGSSLLLFRHTVMNGEQDLNDIGITSPLTLMSGSIKSSITTFNASLGFTIPSTAGINVDAVIGPSVLLSYAPVASTYVEGQDLDFTLIFNRTVIITGVPRLPINLGAGTIYADYQPALSSGASVVFRYTVSSSDSDLDGITIISPLDLNAGTIKDTNGLNAHLVYSPPSTSGIYVDGLAPSISNLTAPLNGTYSPSQTLNFTATFNEAVTVTGTPRIALNVGGATLYADYLSGSGSSSLIFRYSISPGDADTDGIAMTASIDLNSGTIKDLRNHNLSPLTFTPPNTSALKVDGTLPLISSVTVTPGTYKRFDTMVFTVSWSEKVIISGTPRFALNVGGTTVYANYDAPTSTDTVGKFRYVVGAGENDLNGITMGASLNLNSGTAKDESGNNANLTFTAPVLTGVLVDAIVPTILSVTPPNNLKYKIGDQLNFTVNWNKPVTIVGAPYLSLTVGSQTLNAVYFSGTTTSSTVFRYTVGVGHIDTNGINLHSSVYLNSGTIKDSIGNDAYLSFTAPVLASVLVDGVIPVIGLVTVSADDTYKLSQPIDFTFTWSEIISVNTTGGTPRLTLDVGGTTRYATYVSGSGTNKLVFRYTVLLNDIDTDGIQVMPLLPAVPLVDLNLGTIKDPAGNDASLLTYGRPLLTGVLVDGVRPVISSIIPPASTTHLDGATLNFTVNWSEAMDVVGTPRLQLTIGSSTVYADYVSGTGTTALIFSYTIVSGDEDLNGVSIVGPLDLNGGSLQDPVTNDGYLTFSPATYSSVKVDAKAPDFVSATTAKVGYKANEYIDYLLKFSEPINVIGAPSFVININGTNYNAVFEAGAGSGNGTNTIRFRYLVPTANTMLDLDGIVVTPTIVLNGGSMKDGVDYIAPLPFTFTEKDYVHYGNTIARYHVAGNDYGVAGSFISGLMDISGGTSHITASPKPTLGVGGFGTNLTDFVQFNNSGSFSLNTMPNVKYIMIVYKTPTTQPANPFGTEAYKYSLIGNTSSNFLYLTNVSNIPRIRFQSSHRLKINNGSLTGFATDHYLSLPSKRWNPNTTYIYQIQSNASAGTSFSGQRLGNANFAGQIAEIIFLNNSVALTAVQLNNMTNQLNAIHGAY